MHSLDKFFRTLILNNANVSISEGSGIRHFASEGYSNRSWRSSTIGRVRTEDSEQLPGPKDN